MALDGVSLANTIDRVSESVEQDQPARMCRLILIYTLRRYSPWSHGLHVCIVKVAPILQNHVYWLIKISRTIFEKGHQRNIPVGIYFKIWPAVSQEILKEVSKIPFGCHGNQSF